MSCNHYNYEPEESRGKRLAYMFVILMTALLIGVVYQHTNREPAEIIQPEISASELVEAYDSNDVEKLKDLAVEIGVDLETIKSLALTVKDERRKELSHD